MKVRFKAVALIGLFLAGSITLSGCNVFMGELVDPGYVALLVDNYGADKGIENAQIFEGGRVRYNPATQQYYEYPVFFRTYNFADDNTVKFSAKGSTVSADLGVTYRFRYTPIDSKKSEKYTYLHEFFRLYRVSPDAFNDSTLKNALRDCANASASTLEPVQLASDNGKLLKPIEGCLAEKFPQIEVKEVSLLKPVSLPKDIQDSINASFKANQDAQTAKANTEKAKAEAQAKVAEATGEAQVRLVRAQAESDANAKLNASLTAKVLELRRLEIEKIRAEKWNGEMAPTVQTPNVQLGGGAKQ